MEVECSIVIGFFSRISAARLVSENNSDSSYSRLEGRVPVPRGTIAQLRICPISISWRASPFHPRPLVFPVDIVASQQFVFFFRNDSLGSNDAAPCCLCNWLATGSVPKEIPCCWFGVIKIERRKDRYVSIVIRIDRTCIKLNRIFFFFFKVKVWISEYFVTVLKLLGIKLEHVDILEWIY